MSARPRTPEYFPRMKNRAAGRAIRKRRRKFRQFMDALRFARVAMAGLGEALSAVGVMAVRAADVIASAWQCNGLGEVHPAIDVAREERMQ